MSQKNHTNSQTQPITHALTIDVEDYYHVAAFKDVIPPQEWHQWPSRVEQNTDHILQILDNKKVSATFFILGWVAEKFPNIVKAISTQGHEIASHGYSHQLIYEQEPDTFRQETQRSKCLLEDLTQQPVHGYRAASYSITQKSLWAIDILLDLGFTWDSSIFPVYHDNYGIPGTPHTPYTLTGRENRKLLETPMTTAFFGKAAIPAAGGGYFRLYPYWLSRYLFARATRKQAGVFYLHPWEIDPAQPRVTQAGLLSKFRHYNNLARCQPRLMRLLEDFNFSTMSNLIEQLEVDNLDSIDVQSL